MIRYIVVCIAIASLVCLKTFGNELKRIRFGDGPNYTRVVFDVESDPEFHRGSLKSPPRFYVDLKNTVPSSKFIIGEFTNDVVQSVRHAKRGENYRITLDLSRDIEPQVSILPPLGIYGHRLVIDFYRGRNVDQEDCKKSVDPHDRVVVVVDAGHGGEDPGAIGIGKVMEKNIVLPIAKKVHSELNKVPGFRSYLTRGGDYEVPLYKRREIAREKRANLFVSIHANSISKSDIRGAMVFMLSSKSSTDLLSSWLERNENESDVVGGITGWVNTSCNLGEKIDSNVNQIISEMKQSHTVAESSEIGKAVLSSMAAVAPIHSRNSVAEARFLVLKSTVVPSILVETGFITNVREAQLLSNKSHQDKLGEAIARGIRSHFCRRPPPHAKLLRGGVSCDSITIEHLVQKNDTLGELARAYSVPIAVIRVANNLKSDKIRVGQVLTIPTGSGS